MYRHILAEKAEKEANKQWHHGFLVTRHNGNKIKELRETARGFLGHGMSSDANKFTFLLVRAK